MSQILDVVEFDKETPILMVLYTHDLASKGPSRGSRTWMQNLMDTQTAMPKITATLNEQHLLLRLLKSNSKRLSSSYSPSRTALDRHMTLSFLPPVGPLESKDIARLNTNDGCSICGDPAKSKCSRCAAIRYCGPGVSFSSMDSVIMLTALYSLPEGGLEIPQKALFVSPRRYLAKCRL